MRNKIATFQFIHTSLQEIFKLGFPEKISFLFIIVANAILLSTLFLNGKIDNYFTFQEAPLYVNASKRLFKYQSSNISKSESLNILPISSFFIKIFSFGNLKFGQCVFTIFSNSILYFSFIRLFSFPLPFFIKNSSQFIFPLILFSIFPVRFFTFRNAPLPDSLFISFIFLSLVFYQTSHSLLTLFCIILASYTKPEGIILYIVFIIISIFQKNIYDVLLFLFTFILEFSIKQSFLNSILVDFSIYQYYIPNYLGFGIENKIHQHNEFYNNLTLPFSQFQVLKKIFPTFSKISYTIGYLRQIHTLFLNYGLCFGGSLILLFISPILAIFGFTWLFFSFFLDCYDPIRFLIPLELISIYCGFSYLFSNERIRFAISIMIIPVFCLDIYYTYWQYVNWQAFVQ